MPDWTAYVRRRLSLPDLRRDREIEIIEDLARQLDDAYREALAQGATETDARAAAEAHIPDWTELGRQLASDPRHRQPASARWQDRLNDRAVERRRPGSLVAGVLHDVTYAGRVLRHGGTATAVALLSLALGIGANTAIFTVINALLFRPLPVAHPEELVSISDPATSGMGSGIEGGERTLFSYHEYEGFRDRTDTLTHLAAFSSEPSLVRVAITGSDEGRNAGVTMVSGSFFPALGIQPAEGTFFGPDVDSARLAHPVAVISDRFWRLRLDADPHVVGRSLRINRDAFTIVGRLPSSFSGLVVGDAPDVYVPLTMQEAVIVGRDLLTQPPGVARRVMFLHVVGRLKPGVTIAQAAASVNTAFHQGIDAEAALITNPDRRRNLTDASATVHDIRYGLSPLRSQYRDPLFVLMGLVGLLLLLACVNVANLLLARATARRREFAVRVALGAGRARLIRQLLTEAGVLVCLGTVAGVAVSGGGVALLLKLVSGDGSSVPLDTRADLRVLLFTIGLAAVTALVCGLLPAIRATKLDLNRGLRGAAAHMAGAGRGMGRWPAGKVLAAVQIALSLVLLVAAGLFMRTLLNLGSVSLGYDPDPIVMFRVNPAAAGYTAESARPLYDDLLSRLATIHGVQRASYSENGLFYGSDTSDGVSFPAHPIPPGVDPDVRLDRVGPGYFATVGIPVVIGRDVQVDDLAGPGHCWLNQTMSRRFFGTDSPAGQQMVVHYSFGDGACEILGVVGDARMGDLRAETPPRVYLPLFPALVPSTAAIVELHVGGDPTAAVSEVRRILQTVNPAFPPPAFHTVSELIGQQLSTERLIARLAGIFGLLALVLAGIGIYGVLSYSVSRRVNEIGLRMALGSGRGRILGLIFREAAAIAVIGAAAGLAGAAAATGLIGAMLFGLSARDPFTLAAGLALSVGVALVAAAVPAWRAARTDPMRALRSE